MPTSFPVGQAPWEATTSSASPSNSSTSFAVGSAPWETSTPSTPSQPVLSPIQPDDTQGTNATFKATGNESPLQVTAKVLGNLPSSALNFAKNTLQFLNPLNTIKTAQNLGTSAGEGLNEGDNASQLAKDTVTGLPSAAYHLLVPQFLQHVFNGDYGKAAATIQNDPIGQMAPLLMVGRSVADSMGKSAEFDSAMQTIASPVTKVASKAADTAGTLATQVLGASTGGGASSIKQAFSANPAFMEAMRGNVSPEDIVQNAQDAVQNIVDTRRATYLGDLEKISGQTGTLDITPVQDAVQTQLKNFGVKVNDDGSLDFSRSSIANNGSARADIQGVYDTVKKWGTQEGDLTPVGVDTLKKQLADFYSPSGSARAFVQAVKSNVSSILQKQVPGYSEMTGKYAQASQLLDDIKSATGVGGKSKVDTVFTKLTTALKGDKELRLQVLDQMQAAGSQPDLMAQLAGSNLSSYVPKGLVGRGLDITAVVGILSHFFNPTYIPMLLATSPRVVGEFVHALGISADHAKVITNAINQYGGKLPTAPALGATSQSNQAPGKPQSTTQ